MNSNTKTPEIILSLENVVKKFGNHTVLDQVSLDVCKHDVIVICGPSGSGKSTLIRTINGLEKISAGKILYRGQLVSDKNIKDIRKRVGMVFQQFNLFNNLSVEENLTIAPIHVLKKTKKEALDRAKEYLETFGIPEKLHAYPHQLSGGQKQRVAIVRSLLMEPDIMLFDEPTSALDPEMIKEVLDAIRRLSSIGMTMLIVTHEMNFAHEVANRICFLEDAKILANTNPEDFFNAKNNPRLELFLSMILKR